MLGLLMTIPLHTIYFKFFLLNTKSHPVFYVPIKSPKLDSNGFSVVIFTFDAHVKEKKNWGQIFIFQPLN